MQSDVNDVLRALRSQRSDYLLVSSNKTLVNFLDKSNKSKDVEGVRFSDSTLKINHRGKEQERHLIITNVALYNFLPGKYSSAQRCIPLRQLRAMVLSRRTDEILFQVSGDYDYRFRIVRRAEVVDVVTQLYERAAGPGAAPLSVTFVDDIDEVQVTKEDLKKGLGKGQERRESAMRAQVLEQQRSTAIRTESTISKDAEEKSITDGVGRVSIAGGLASGDSRGVGSAGLAPTTSATSGAATASAAAAGTASSSSSSSSAAAAAAAAAAGPAGYLSPGGPRPIGASVLSPVPPLLPKRVPPSTPSESGSSGVGSGIASPVATLPASGSASSIALGGPRGVSLSSRGPAVASGGGILGMVDGAAHASSSSSAAAAAAAAATSGPVQGWLSKKSHSSDAWRRRYFRLSPHNLLYYDARTKGCVPLNSGRVQPWKNYRYSAVVREARQPVTPNHMRNILRDPERREAFLSFCKQQHNEENALFFLAVDEFRRLPCGTPDHLAAAMRVYDTYVRPGAPMEVSAGDTVRGLVSREIERVAAAAAAAQGAAPDPAESPPLEPSLFDLLQRAVLATMHMDPSGV